MRFKRHNAKFIRVAMSQAQKAFIEYACALLGVSMTSFISGVAIERAEEATKQSFVDFCDINRTIIYSDISDIDVDGIVNKLSEEKREALLIGLLKKEKK